MASLLALLAGTATCVPDLGPGDAQITSTRILAVRADPPEARPGTLVTFTSLVASPAGTVSSPGLAWSFCTAPKPLTEDNVVSDACLGSSALVAAGTGPIVTAALPVDGCSTFGPDASSNGLRPRDPDATGGYYQPLRAVLAGTDPAFELARIHCDLANAPADVAGAFAAAYMLNENPTLLPLTATTAGSPASFAGVHAGVRVVLEARWPAGAAETFAYFDLASQTVTTQRESMQVAWYTTAGTLDTESTGRAANDLATTSDDGWVAPSNPGTVHLWVVLRDSRGGAVFIAQDVTVIP